MVTRQKFRKTGSLYQGIVNCLYAASPSDENSATQLIFSQRVAGVKRLALTQPQSADDNEDDLDPDGFDRSRF